MLIKDCKNTKEWFELVSNTISAYDVNVKYKGIDLDVRVNHVRAIIQVMAPNAPSMYLSYSEYPGDFNPKLNINFTGHLDLYKMKELKCERKFIFYKDSNGVAILVDLLRSKQPKTESESLALCLEADDIYREKYRGSIISCF